MGGGREEGGTVYVRGGSDVEVDIFRDFLRFVWQKRERSTHGCQKV